jgi:hypothetical protein
MTRLVALALAAQLAVPGALWAQEPQPASESKPPAVDASRLGVSLDRIKRELAQAEEADKSPDALKFSFTVQVVGSAPKIDFLQGFSLNGAMPYGSPTHQEVLDVVTPREYRSPVIPFSAMAYWAARQLYEKSKRTRCEEELAEYRRLVMAGVAVAAPRCSQ